MGVVWLAALLVVATSAILCASSSTTDRPLLLSLVLSVRLSFRRPSFCAHLPFRESAGTIQQQSQVLLLLVLVLGRGEEGQRR